MLQKNDRKIYHYFLSLVVIVLFFQNCDKAGFDSHLDNSSELGGSNVDLTAKYGSVQAAKVEGIPFAYDVSFDTITYNSCTGSHLRSQSQFRSLTVGAYSQGGVRLLPRFFNYVEQNFSPTYPSTTFNPVQYKELLADSPANRNIVPNIALRRKNNLTFVYHPGNLTNPRVGEDIVDLVSNLSHPLVSESFINGSPARYFPFSPDIRNVEAVLNFNSSEGLADTYRDDFARGAVLSLAFRPTSASDVRQIVAPEGASGGTAYGRGLQLVFSAPTHDGMAFSNNPLRSISSIQEYDLSRPNNLVVEWSCNLKYKVVRMEDRETHCPALRHNQLSNVVPGRTPSRTVREELAIAYRQLKADEWDINPLRNCAVPKPNQNQTVSCYHEAYTGSDPERLRQIEYDTTKECYNLDSTIYTDQNFKKKCMHFITVCTRP